MSTYIQPPVSVNAAVLYQAFVDYMTATVPGWQPGRPNLDDFIAQGFAGVAAQIGELCSDGTTASFRWFGANILQFPPNGPQAATGLVTIVATDSVGHTIAAGTIINFTDGLGNTQQFQTVATATIAASSTTVTGVAVSAVIPGVAGNGITGTGTPVVPPLAWISSITLAGATTGGQDSETDAAYLGRLATNYQILTPKPILPADFALVAIADDNVGRAICLGGYDPTATEAITGTVANASPNVTAASDITKVGYGTGVSGTNIPANSWALSASAGTITLNANATGAGAGESITLTGLYSQPGVLTVWVTAADGTDLSSPARAAVAADLNARVLPGVVVYVRAPNRPTINVVANVVAYPGQDTTAIGTAVTSAITSFFNSAVWGLPPGARALTWTNEPTVRLALLDKAILSVLGVHYTGVVTLNGSAADVAMQGPVALPTLGTLTVNVTTG